MSGIKRNILTVKERMDVLKDLETTSMTQVAIAHKIHIRTVFRIKKEAANIAQIAKSANGAKIRRRRKPKFPELEQQLYTWFVERKTLGDKLSDTILLEKARELKDSLKLHPSSKISMGWLHRFKKRNNIRLVHLYRKKASTDEIAAQSFINELKNQIQEEGIDSKCIYNMDETELLWKALPSNTLARNEEVDLSDDKEKVTIALCANATGTHKLKPFLIYKYKKPKALKNGTNQLPVIYASQKNAWMDEKLFLEWFSYFKESVKLFQLQEGICSKIILLLDNCEERRLPINYTDDINIEIKYLPPNTKYLIQPMDQGIIAETKQIFRHKLMQCVITYAGGATEFYKMYNIKDCIIMLDNAWADVTSNNIKNSWHKLLPYTRMHGEVRREGEEEMEEEDVKNVLTTCHLEERNQIHDQCRNENMVQGRWDEGADVTSNNIKNSWHKLLPYTRMHGEVGREGEEEVEEEEDIKNVLTTCHLEERNQTHDECRNVNTVQGRWDEGADVTSNNIKNSWHKLLPYTQMHGEVGREGEEEVEEEDVKNVLTTCHLEERNQTHDKCRNENTVQGRRDDGASVTQRTGGLALKVEERRRLEYVFAELEVFNDRASPAMQAQAKSLKLLYLGPT